jgi:hypothetical protein
MAKPIFISIVDLGYSTGAYRGLAGNGPMRNSFHAFYIAVKPPANLLKYGKFIELDGKPGAIIHLTCH